MSPQTIIATLLLLAVGGLHSYLDVKMPGAANLVVTQVLTGLGLVSLLLIHKPGALAWITTVEQALEQASPGALAKLKAKTANKSVPPMAVLMLASLLSFGAFTTAANTTACHATPAEVAQTAGDIFRAAGCILANVFAGNVTPETFTGSCANAEAQVVSDVITDFYQQPAVASSPTDGGRVGTAWDAITPAQRANCDKALAIAKTRIAAKAVK